MSPSLRTSMLWWIVFLGLGAKRQKAVGFRPRRDTTRAKSTTQDASNESGRFSMTLM